ncbi:FHA domain-containing protein [Actinomadura verrucosospora]|uniref:Translation initiation factor 2 (BIF-2) n=1 Tax=Actinomadura verrucosospora TaxID=46165 RepID=A0A7D3ZZE8_ACTVE|nr:FHA domain-containing protein [Actinomadura verrucosospora]QKG22064.1 translation initiation factor 2 (bIF-2) [Actinomadura verrucosospora]
MATLNCPVCDEPYQQGDLLCLSCGANLARPGGGHRAGPGGYDQGPPQHGAPPQHGGPQHGAPQHGGYPPQHGQPYQQAPQHDYQQPPQHGAPQQGGLPPQHGQPQQDQWGPPPQQPQQQPDQWGPPPQQQPDQWGPPPQQQPQHGAPPQHAAPQHGQQPPADPWSMPPPQQQQPQQPDQWGPPPQHQQPAPDQYRQPEPQYQQPEQQYQQPPDQYMPQPGPADHQFGPPPQQPVAPPPHGREATLLPPDQQHGAHGHQHPQQPDSTAFMCPYCEAVLTNPGASQCNSCGRQLSQKGTPVLRVQFPTGELKVSVGQHLVLGRDAGQSPVAATFTQYDNVSRRHSTVWLDPSGTAWVRDEGSTNGTFVNGERLPRGVEAPLRDGDQLRLAADVTGTVQLA